MNKLQRIFGLLLCLLLALSCLGMAAFAEEEETAPIEVRTIEDLYNIRNDLTADYILMNDIDLTAATAKGGDWDYGGRGWNPIGSKDTYSNGAFSGTFDGNGHSIIGMRIDVTSVPSGTTYIYAGLFANVTGTVKNVHMKNVSVSVKTSYEDIYVGGVAARLGSKGVISGSDVSGSIYGYNSYSSSSSSYGDARLGGIVGYSSGTIEACFNTASVNAEKGYYAYAGGITGYLSNSDAKATITNCYNTGKVNAEEHAGGIAGYMASTSAISKCYNSAKVSQGTGSGYGVAYIGNGHSATISNSYYLTGTGFSSTGTTSLTEAQMQIQTVYAGFDFEQVWCINKDAVHSYPQLQSNAQDLRVITSAKINTLPEKTVYELGESFDATGLVLEFLYENAEAEYVQIATEQVSGFDPAVLGTQTLSVTYNFRTFTFEVTVTERPYTEIRTIQDLYNIRNDLTANYILKNDIDLTAATAKGGDWDYGGRGWNPIGSKDTYSNGAFSGTFDGNGYSIIGMRIDVTSVPSGTTYIYAGLFANVTGTVKNVHMKNVSVSVKTSYEDIYVGGVAARLGSKGVISGSDVSGSIYGYNSYSSSSSSYGDARLGGIVGYSSGTIEACFNTASVNAEKGYTAYAGGITGYLSNSDAKATITNCYNTGKVNAEEHAGGIAGYMASTSAISKCYNCAKVSQGTGSGYGIAYIGNGHSATISNSYYLAGTGNGSTGATSLTEGQMKLQSMYVGFDFENTWVIDPYAVYPYPQLKSNPQNLEEGVEIMGLISWPVKLEYFVGEELDLTGCLMDITYTSGRQELIFVTADMVSGYDKNQLGDQTITVSYRGGEDYFDVTVIERPEIASIEMATLPTKTEFVVRTAFDFTGAQIKLNYTTGQSDIIPVTGDMISGGNINKLGKQTITVTFGAFTTTFTVTVKSASAETLRIDQLPAKLVYKEGESLDLTGMTVTVIMNNGTQYSLSSGYTVSGFNSVAGKHTITVTYQGKSATFEVEVLLPVEKFDIDVARMILGNALEFQFGVAQTKIPDKTGFYAVIEKTWADGTTTTKTIPAAEWGVAGAYWAIVYDGLAAKEMGDTFYVTIYNADGAAVSNSREDSVRAYVERAYKSQSATGKTMMVDMLNYGAAAQVHFKYGTDDLANNKLTAEQLAAGTAATPEMSNDQVKGNFYLGTRFILESRIQVQLAFANLTQDMYAVYTYTNAKGEEQTVRVEGKDFVISGGKPAGVELSALVYADARTLVNVTVYNADGTVYGTATDSIESCALRSNADVFVALMKFADSAREHLY